MKKSVFVYPAKRCVPGMKTLFFFNNTQEEFTMIQLSQLPVRYGKVPLRVARGHFATNHSHINYYIDITNQKIRLADAKAVAAELAKNFANTQIDTILCMDGMTLVGACLADAL